MFRTLSHFLQLQTRSKREIAMFRTRAHRLRANCCMRRRVDARWRLNPADFTRMQGRQIEIVRTVAPLLKAGGTLVYSTCSLEGEENEDVVQQLVQTMSILQLEEERSSLPFRDNFDGAFVARFRRRD